MADKKRRVIFITKHADGKLLKEQKRRKAALAAGENKNLKVSQIVEDLVTNNL